MRYSLDTEFIETPPHHRHGVRFHGSIQLISVALVAADGRHFHEISSEFNPEDANDWVRDNVLPKLPPVRAAPRRSLEQIRARFLDFIGGDTNPRFWAYFADYDWVATCWIFGAMIQLPKHFPMYCYDLKQAMHHLGIPRSMLPSNPKNAHNALEDAIWVHEALKVVDPIAEARGIYM